MPKKNKKKAKDAAIQLGEGFRKVAMAAATHPSTFGIMVMGIATIGNIINFHVSKKNKDGILAPYGQFRHQQFRGIYEGAQAIALASALAPVAVGALGVVKAAVTKAPVPTGYP